MEALAIKERIYSLLKGLIVLFIITGFGEFAIAGKIKTALKALEKGEFDKVEEILQKSIAKNNLDPGSGFVYSILYSIDSFPRYNLDSAHYHIIKAENEYSQLGEKEIEDLIKDEVTKDHIYHQHHHVDSLAYVYALEQNSLRSFEYFLSNYYDAKEANQATDARNSLAYQQASQQNTWQAYKAFIERYSDASETIEATKEYNRLIFEEKTESGTLNELETFLKEYPQTPYRQGLEEKIFDLISTLGEEEKILDFINQYFNPKWQKRGMDLLNYLHPESDTFSNLLKTTPWKGYQDSLRRLQEMNNSTLVPYFENGKYGFADLDGEIALDMQFDDIGKNFYCGDIKTDILDIKLSNSHLLVNRNLDTVYIGDFEAYHDLGLGILKIVQEKKVGAIHSTGFSILPTEFSEISILTKQLLRVSKSEKYGIYSIMGKELVPIDYNDIYISNKYIIFEKNEKISINLIDTFIQQVRNGKFKPELKYEGFEIIGKAIICFDGNYEVLFDSLLNEVVPFAEQRINTKFDTWVIKQPEGYRLFDQQSGKLQNEVYRKVLQNDQWLAVIGNNKWSLYGKSLSDIPIVDLDSVNLLGEDIALTFRDNKGMAIFPNKKIVVFSKDEKLSSISSDKNTEVHFLVISKNGKNTLYRNGERVIESVYEIGYISDEVFSAKSRGEFGAMDSKANLIMRIRYDAIGESENGISPVIYNGRFGAYNFNDRILISLKFDEKLKPYNDQLLVTKFRAKKGLHSIKNENILDTEYDELIYWSDSVALLKNLEQWSLFNFYSKKSLLSEILDFDYICKDAGNQIIKFRTSLGMGVYSHLNGLLFEPTFNDIINIGNSDIPFYFCEKSIPEADYFVAVYKNRLGETVRTHAYRGEEYEKIVCEE